MKGGTTAMKSIRYRRGRENERDLAVYTRLMAEDNGSQLQQLRRNLAQALREEVTERQKQVLFLYYNQGLTMREIGAALGVDRSTVSRTIKRGRSPAPPLPALWRGGVAPRVSGGGGKKKFSARR